MQCGLNLVGYLEGIFWNTRDIEEAFERLRLQCDDIVLDFPRAQETLNMVVGKAEQQGLISPEYKRIDDHHMV